MSSCPREAEVLGGLLVGGEVVLHIRGGLRRGRTRTLSLWRHDDHLDIELPVELVQRRLIHCGEENSNLRVVMRVVDIDFRINLIIAVRIDEEAERQRCPTNTSCHLKYWIVD